MRPLFDFLLVRRHNTRKVGGAEIRAPVINILNKITNKERKQIVCNVSEGIC